MTRARDPGERRYRIQWFNPAKGKWAFRASIPAVSLKEALDSAARTLDVPRDQLRKEPG